jgi:hypothetical protein
MDVRHRPNLPPFLEIPKGDPLDAAKDEITGIILWHARSMNNESGEKECLCQIPLKRTTPQSIGERSPCCMNPFSRF